MTIPPDYLEGKVAISAGTGPAVLLQDGQWRRHGEPEYDVFDVQVGNEKIFSIQLPDLDAENDEDELTAPVVMVHSDSGDTFPIYDPRKHPASLFCPEDGEPEFEPSPLQTTFRCPNCDQQRFYVSVGFEVPSDSQSPNDTSWFALAVKCVACGWGEIIYDDETA
jgi:hypothetical protein